MVKLCKASQDAGTRPTTGADRLTISGCSRFKEYRRRRLIFVKVLKMLSPRRSGSDGAGGSKTGNGAMPATAYEDESGTKEFLSTGRTGRRNALPDILGRPAATGVSDLPDRFGELSMEADRSKSSGERKPDQLCTSKQHAG
ncbi:hypothetical protein KPH14_011222 [Odynerus spinipes]|uniref:Uncharacterized protein n=1 Tax=Odynerus spinipes TaxID=1348599 RepID=A0AAD9R9G1_9HYME|nr:hypothetical protein KPH14_011222 [Odynerus spinipes]